MAAQAPGPKRYNFAHYTEESGLNSYQVNATVQDDDGYIWIATNEGLQRYDGLRYKSFGHVHNDSTSIPSKSILQLLIDKNKNLWILTREGKVGIFNTKKFTFNE
ncbi:ligand-binding sensor domain-containing protein [Arenibacter antarcticus]|uniref:Two-component regulator propeller domain-containing protein n=1 Tax=Arenibacter antarcticus TaxID=2040469 RepID=A0ABW5VL70_9FLAO